MSYLISWQSYFLFNIAIQLSYMLSYFILKLPFFHNSLSKADYLKSARIIFLITCIVFLLVPCFMDFFPQKYQDPYQLQPILKQASAVFLQNHDVIKTKIDSLHEQINIGFSIRMVFHFVIILGFIYFLIRYTRSICNLKNIVNNAYCYKTIGRTKILFSNQVIIPFCWSSLKSHYVVLPMHLLEKKNDLYFSIKHELQHIRQGDTHWLHFMTILKLFCFWNPFLMLWNNWFEELQEFACDEALIINKKTSPIDYAQCLVDMAVFHSSDVIFSGTLGMMGISNQYNHSLSLKRRITMLFNYKQSQPKKLFLLSVYAACFFTSVSATYALDTHSTMDALSTKELSVLIDRADNVFHITATPEVVKQINEVRASEQGSAYLRAALVRMKQYQANIEQQLKNYNMPKDLLSIPLVESGYRPLEAKQNPVSAAGIWQIIPSTGKNLGLVINENRDDRMNTELATKAALKYLNALYAQFKDWKLAVIAYEYGEDQVEKLINQVGSRNAWMLARSKEAPAKMKDFLALFDASVIIMQNPSLISS